MAAIGGRAAIGRRSGWFIKNRCVKKSPAVEKIKTMIAPTAEDFNTAVESASGIKISPEPRIIKSPPGSMFFIFLKNPLRRVGITMPEMALVLIMALAKATICFVL